MKTKEIHLLIILLPILLLSCVGTKKLETKEIVYEAQCSETICITPDELQIAFEISDILLSDRNQYPHIFLGIKDLDSVYIELFNFLDLNEISYSNVDRSNLIARQKTFQHLNSNSKEIYLNQQKITMLTCDFSRLASSLRNFHVEGVSKYYVERPIFHNLNKMLGEVELACSLKCDDKAKNKMKLWGKSEMEFDEYYACLNGPSYSTFYEHNWEHKMMSIENPCVDVTFQVGKRYKLR